jgi:polyhydroxyalkanoate synthesis regulator protein
MQAEMAKALETPMAPIAEMARQNMEMWAKMQASMLSAFGPAGSPGASEKPERSEKTEKSERAGRPEPGKRRG